MVPGLMHALQHVLCAADIYGVWVYFMSHAKLYAMIIAFRVFVGYTWAKWRVIFPRFHQRCPYMMLWSINAWIRGNSQNRG